jgi:hypothetical protein
VRHDAGWTFPRQVLEALEALEAVPLPARCGFQAVPGGVAVEARVHRDSPQVRQEVARSLEVRGVPLRALHLVEDPRELHHPLPLRCDLKEASFPPYVADALPAAVALPGAPGQVERALARGG